MKVYSITLLINISFVLSHLSAQTGIDSLLIKLNQTEDVIERCDIFINIGNSHSKTQPDSAIYYYRQCHNIALSNQNINYQALSLKLISELHNSKRDNSKALDYSYKALQLFEESEDNLMIATLLHQIASIFIRERKFEDAFESALKASEIFIEIENKDMASVCINLLGIIKYTTGNFEEAKIFYLESLKYYEELSDIQGIARANNNIGLVFYQIGDYEKSTEHHLKSLAIKEELKDIKGMAASYNNLGIISRNKGDFDKAIDFFQKSLSIYENLNEKAQISGCLMNIGLINNNQGNYEKAIDYFEKALDINKSLGSKKGVADAYNNIGLSLIFLSKHSEAHNYFQNALIIGKEIDDIRGTSKILANIGLIYHFMLDYEKAFEYYRMSLQQNEEIGNMFAVSRLLGNIAYIHTNLADKVRGIDSLQYLLHLDSIIFYSLKSIEIAEALGALSIKADVSSTLAKAYYGKGDYIKAESYFLENIELTNRSTMISFSFISESEKELFFNKIANTYMAFYSFALERMADNPNIINEVYNNALKTKGLLLKSSTAMRNAVLSSGDSIMIDNYNEWLKLKKEISKLYTSESVNQLNSLKDIEEHANTLEKELIKSSKTFADFTKIQDINWRDIQNGLKKNEAAIEFLHFKTLGSKLSLLSDTTFYCALIIRPESTHPEMIKLCEESDIQSLLEMSTINTVNYINSIYGTRSAKNPALYKLLWEPLEKHIEGVKTVYISPSGLLHKISFASIYNDQNLYLCDAYDIRMQTSTAKLAMPETFKFNKDITASIFGGINYNKPDTKIETWKYLEGTKAESEKIYAIFKKQKIKASLYSGSESTEDVIKSNAGNSNILHIATHGFFFPDPATIREKEKTVIIKGEVDFRGGSESFGSWAIMKNPNPLMRSGLVFAGANAIWDEGIIEGEDGVLTAQEVAHIDLRNTELVVLSACETGLGDIKGTEGVYGLQRAFKMAGAKFIIMSLWQVPDKETEEFMVLLYSYIFKYKDIRKAFSQTQNEMRKKYDPFYWAAFVLIE
jgi:CHAT domain-containing protein/Tfp pilus assembly protein PilF